MILRKLIAVFMALAIANPACCCAFKAHTGKVEVQSCCKSSSDSPGNSQKEDAPCSCSFAKEKAAPDHDAIIPDLTPSHLLPPVLASADYRDLLPNLSQAVSFLKKWPPGTLPIPDSSARLAAKCSYLI